MKLTPRTKAVQRAYQLAVHPSDTERRHNFLTEMIWKAKVQERNTLRLYDHRGECDRFDTGVMGNRVRRTVFKPRMNRLKATL